MNPPRLLTLLGLLLFGALLSLSSPVYADNGPRFDDVRELLEKAWSPGTDAPPSNADRIELLKEAMKLLKDAPHNYRNHRVQAMKLIDSALYELNKGDLDHKAVDYIHSAVEEVRDIT